MTGKIAFIGFGEAAQAFLTGWRVSKTDLEVAAHDRKTDISAPAAIRQAKRADFSRHGVRGADSNSAAIAGAAAIFSLVTADQAVVAATETAMSPLHGALFLDCNSCSPGAKRQSAAKVEAAGGRYVDVAIMSPVHPRLHRTPILLSGPHAQAARALMGDGLGMDVTIVEGEIGRASSVKMVRSIMVKGLEALALECVLAGRRSGVEAMVLDTLEDSYPGFGWRRRTAYMMERVATHGIRRAAEMREVAATVAELGLDPAMSEAITHWQQRVGELGIDLSGLAQEDPGAAADVISAALREPEAASHAAEAGKRTGE